LNTCALLHFMTQTLSTRTICCKLALDEGAQAALRETQAAFHAAATYCAQIAWERGVTNKNKLHHLVYGSTRATYGLGAQLACCARDKESGRSRPIGSGSEAVAAVPAGGHG